MEIKLMKINEKLSVFRGIWFKKKKSQCSRDKSQIET